ncbi:hypothetical protein A0H81_03661 [Grifola frondosa]|uniref:Uncharacterized protein n=1 Tax=Grifola frondosa TaxID=5627 RepID=A0A1C7MHR6_GRIFR|nr:hypothetical protein A0H81_03661 [Grifola frondosa]
MCSSSALRSMHSQIYVASTWQWCMTSARGYTVYTLRVTSPLAFSGSLDISARAIRTWTWIPERESTSRSLEAEVELARLFGRAPPDPASPCASSRPRAPGMPLNISKSIQIGGHTPFQVKIEGWRCCAQNQSRDCGNWIQGEPSAVGTRFSKLIRAPARQDNAERCNFTHNQYPTENEMAGTSHRIFISDGFCNKWEESQHKARMMRALVSAREIESALNSLSSTLLAASADLNQHISHLDEYITHCLLPSDDRTVEPEVTAPEAIEVPEVAPVLPPQVPMKMGFLSRVTRKLLS